MLVRKSWDTRLGLKRYRRLRRMGSILGAVRGFVRKIQAVKSPKPTPPIPSFSKLVRTALHGLLAGRSQQCPPVYGREDMWATTAVCLAEFRLEAHVPGPRGPAARRRPGVSKGNRGNCRQTRFRHSPKMSHRNQAFSEADESGGSRGHYRRPVPGGGALAYGPARPRTLLPQARTAWLPNEYMDPEFEAMVNF